MIDPLDFLEALWENEVIMADVAAMAATCEQFDISEEEGYNLLIESSYMPDNDN